MEEISEVKGKERRNAGMNNQLNNVSFSGLFFIYIQNLQGKRKPGTGSRILGLARKSRVTHVKNKEAEMTEGNEVFVAGKLYTPSVKNKKKNENDKHKISVEVEESRVGRDTAQSIKSSYRRRPLCKTSTRVA